MRLFSSRHDEASLEPEDMINLLWRYEVSDDGGKTWQPEADREGEDCYLLRRGNWVEPQLN
jgi:hypothetical protein